MAKIKNIEGMTNNEINFALQNGAKFVVFEYCISIIVMTFRRSSNIHFVKAGESTIKDSIGLTLLTLIFGWWGIPWGPIYTIGAIYKNMTGGKDVTQDVLASLNSQK